MHGFRFIGHQHSAGHHEIVLHRYLRKAFVIEPGKVRARRQPGKDETVIMIQHRDADDGMISLIDRPGKICSAIHQFLAEPAADRICA